MTLIGPFGAYWINVAAIVYTGFLNEKKSGSTFIDNEPMLYLSSYTGLCAVNSFFSFFFIGDILDWYKTELEIQQVKDEEIFGDD